MSHYTPETIPDDPYRVAPPGCAPGEIDAPDVPVVSDKEAVERVLNALKTGSDTAFGEAAYEWCELLLDHIADHKERYLIALLSDWHATLGRLRREMEMFIADRANKRLADMSPDELEREGFAV